MSLPLPTILAALGLAELKLRYIYSGYPGLSPDDRALIDRILTEHYDLWFQAEADRGALWRGEK